MRVNSYVFIALGLLILSLGSMSSSFAQEVPELFSSPLDISSSQSLDTLDFVKDTQLVEANMDAFDSDTVSATIFDEELIITKDRITEHDDYNVWFGSGDNINAVLLINGTTIFGDIETKDSLYRIEFTETDSIHTLQKLDFSSYTEHSSDANSDSSTSDIENLSSDVQDEIKFLENAYVGGKDYSAHKVTIDVVVGYTETVDDNTRSVSSLAALAIEKANDSYNDNHLPIELNLLDTEEAKGYTEWLTDSDDSIYWELYSLGDEDENTLDRVRGVAEKEDADILILLTHYDSGTTCGQANTPGDGEYLPESVDDAYVVVRDSCISFHSFTHEIGHIQGAAHNTQTGHPNYDFSYGHGWYDTEVEARTVMSYDCPAANCTRQGIWSDPYDNFIGAGADNFAGDEDDAYNAKVLFATAPYIASLRGDTVEYHPAYTDVTAPVVTAPSDVSFEATAVKTTITDSQLGTPTAVDDTTVTFTNNSTGTFPLGDTKIQWVGTDEAILNGTAIQTVTIKDTTNPSITAPADVIVMDGDTITLGSATATDIFLKSTTNNSTGTFPIGDTIVRWTAVDTLDNSAYADQTVTVIDLDTEPLLITPNLDSDGKTTSFTINAIGYAPGTTGLITMFNIGIAPESMEEIDIAVSSVYFTYTVTADDLSAFQEGSWLILNITMEKPENSKNQPSLTFVSMNYPYVD